MTTLPAPVWQAARPRALLRAASLEPVPEAVLFQRAGLGTLPGSDLYQRNHRALRLLIEAGLLSKTGPRTRRFYALTPAGLRADQTQPVPPARPQRQTCRLCGRPGGHWSGCALWRGRGR